MARGMMQERTATGSLPPAQPSAPDPHHHVPASHPVLMEQVRKAAVRRPLPEQQATFAHGMTVAIDRLAVDVAELPAWPLTDRQRQGLRIIARQLLRRVNA